MNDNQMKPLQALSNLFKYACNYKVDENHRLGNSKEWKDIVKKSLKALEAIKENLKFGYVFIGFNEKEEPTFYFAPRDMYEEIKKNKNH